MYEYRLSRENLELLGDGGVLGVSRFGKTSSEASSQENRVNRKHTAELESGAENGFQLFFNLCFLNVLGQ